MGGKSDEREISLITGGMIIASLDAERYNITAIDPGIIDVTNYHVGDAGIDIKLHPLNHLVEESCSGKRPDVAVIALHGRFGEDGTVQGMLELLEIPYVGSGVLSSALAMDKIMSRKVMMCDGILVPKGIALDRRADVLKMIASIEEVIGYPVVVKPNRQGSTIGLSLAKDRDQLSTAIKLAFRYDSDVLVEKYINGTEITVPIIGNSELRTLPIVEIVPKNGFYDYHAKYTPGETDEIVPARISDALYMRAEEIAIMCHRSLECRGMSRTDMIVSGDDIFVLEVNTIPGMTPTSLLPLSAKAAGIEFAQLLDILIGLALERN